MSQPTENQLLRRDYLLLLLDGVKDKEARKQLGIKGKDFVKNLRAALERDCSLADAPRTGRPLLYTVDILNDALDWFDQNSWRHLNKQEFFDEVLAVGILPNEATLDGFYPTFKEHLHEQGLHLRWAQRNLTFALTTRHELLREQWCDEHEDTFTEQKLDEFWFCDEIVVEEGGHPKGVDPKCVHLLFNVATLAVSSKCKCSHNIVRPYTLARKESALKHTISAYKLVGGLAALNVQNARTVPGPSLNPTSSSVFAAHPTNFLTSRAGHRHSIPHLYIAGRSPRPAMRFDDDQEQRSFMVAVCVRLGRRNVVVHLPTPEEVVTRAKKKKGSVWVSPQVTACSPLTSKSYCRRVLMELVKAGQQVIGARRHSPRRPVKLVHDKDSVHTSKETRAFAARHNMELIELPARSPDLDPLDYGVFGAVKREWQRRVSKEQLSWSDQCSLLIELLEQADASAAIKALLSRIQKCKSAAGSHFEH